MPGQSKLGFKLLRLKSDNKNMKRAILFLLADWERKKSVDRETDRMLVARLEGSGYRVVRANSMELLHTMAGTHSFDALLISRRFADAHRLEPERHLMDAHSDHVIIVWERGETGIVTCQISQNPDVSRSDNPMRPNYLETARAVALSLEKNSPNEAPRIPEKRDHSLSLPEPASHEMHRKQALILDAITSGGKRGADIPMITYSVWGTTAWDRKKDIQIYVSKLRRFLEQREGPPCSIAYRDKRYYLLSGREKT